MAERADLMPPPLRPDILTMRPERVRPYIRYWIQELLNRMPEDQDYVGLREHFEPGHHIMPADLRAFIEYECSRVFKRVADRRFGIVLVDFKSSIATHWQLMRGDLVALEILLQRIEFAGSGGQLWRWPRLNTPEEAVRTRDTLSALRSPTVRSIMNYQVNFGDLVIDQDGRILETPRPENEADHATDALVYALSWQGEFRGRIVSQHQVPEPQHIAAADVAREGAGRAIELDPDGPGIPGGLVPRVNPLQFLELDDPAPVCPLLVPPDAP